MPKKIDSFDNDLSNEFIIIGIITQIKEYKLCWLLNSNHGFDLKKKADFCLNSSRKKDEKFSFYHYYDSLYRIEYVLITNKNNNCYLIDILPRTDYLLLIRNKIKTEKIKEIISMLSKTENVITAYKIDPSKIKEVNNFFTDVEYHLSEINDLQ